MSALPEVYGHELVAVSPHWDSVVHHDGQFARRAAERHTALMAGKLAQLRDALGLVTDLVEELTQMLETAWARRADIALGHPSFEAYVAAEFGDLGQVRLPVPERVQLVLALYGDGDRVSKRGAARLLAVDDATVRSDLRDHARQAPEPLQLLAAPEDVQLARTLTSCEQPAPQPTKADRIAAAIAAAGPAGRTVHELEAMAKRARWPGSNHHGTISGRLHDVVRRGDAVRTTTYRDGAAVHVASQHGVVS